MDIASLSSFLASSDSEYDHPSSCSSAATATSATKVASTFVKKTRDPTEDGERLAQQLIKAQKLTSEQVSGGYLTNLIITLKAHGNKTTSINAQQVKSPTNDTKWISLKSIKAGIFLD